MFAEPTSATPPPLRLGITEAVQRRSFTTYTIRVVGQQSMWMVDKRYSSFARLHSQLSHEYGAAVMPPLPPKKWFGSGDSAFINKRLQDLQLYLRRLAEIDVLARSDLFLSFLATGDAGVPVKNFVFTPSLSSPTPKLHAAGAEETKESASAAGAVAAPPTGASASEDATSDLVSASSASEPRASPGASAQEAAGTPSDAAAAAASSS